MKETDLYEQIAQYMNYKHRDVIYHFDLSGLWTPSHQARNLYGRLNKRAWPDLFIANNKFQIETRAYEGADKLFFAQQKCGLFIELKKAGTRLYLKDGVTLRAVPHHIEQAAVLESLRSQGYMAEFAVGLNEAIALIEGYLGTLPSPAPAGPIF
jgi:hypothetical protein